MFLVPAPEGAISPRGLGCGDSPNTEEDLRRSRSGHGTTRVGLLHEGGSAMTEEPGSWELQGGLFAIATAICSAAVETP